MAKQCFLCGGALRNGRCTECGLDNTKNDRKYQLNTHNDSGAHFHDGGCEVQVNKKRISTHRKKQEEEKKDTFDYRELLEAEKKKVHPNSSRNKTRTNSRPSGRPSGKNGNSKGGLFFWILLIYIILSILGNR